MRTLIDNKDNFEVVEELNSESKFQIINFYYNKNELLNQVKITLDESKIKISENSLSYFKGNIEIATKSAIQTISKKIFGNIIKKTTEKTILVGSGEVYLVPSLKDYTLIELEDEEIIINSSMFIACEEDVIIEVLNELTNETILSNLNDESNSEFYKGEKVKLSGSGLVALELPVKKEEIKRMKIYRDLISFKEDKVILRTGNIDFELEDSGTKEGEFNIYSGSGELWICNSFNIEN